MPPLNPPAAYGDLDDELPAYVSNGSIGLRVRPVALFAGMTIVNGVVGEHHERRIEAAAAVPYPLAGDISVNGVWLSEQRMAIADLRQDYDFSRGELISRFEAKLGDRQISVETTTFASRSAPSLVLQETVVVADGPCDLRFRAIVDIRRLRGRVARRLTETPGESSPVCDGTMLWETDGGLSTCGIALVSAVEGVPSDKTRMNAWDASGPLVTEHAVRAESGRPVRLRQMAALIPSMIHSRPDEEAARRVAKGDKQGFDALRKANRDLWDDLWKGRITVEGASQRHQALIDAATFYLLSSTHQASAGSTSIFGLATWSNYHYYYGHVMWDIETFCVPPLLLFQPPAARALLNFRTRTRKAARWNARLSNQIGLQFPWEAAPRTGEESTPGGGSAAAHAAHVSLHVARAFSLASDMTGDQRFRDTRAWPVISGVADWFADRVTWTERGAELLKATGPAEVPDPPNNDAFSLMAARDVLLRAIRMAEKVGEAVPAAWRDTLDNLCIPRRGDGVIASHDDFRVTEEKGATPSPLAGLFPFDYPATETERKATLEFYLARWEDYVGSPMLPALYSVWASMLGDRKLALRLFDEGYAAYDSGRFHQCLEYRKDHKDSVTPAGPFFANLGGMLMSLLFGFPGLVIDDGDPAAWPRCPVTLPSGWTSIEVGRLWIRGRPASLTARHGAARAHIAFL